MRRGDTGTAGLLILSLVALVLLALVLAPVVRELSDNVHHITTTTTEEH